MKHDVGWVKDYADDIDTLLVFVSLPLVTPTRRVIIFLDMTGRSFLCCTHGLRRRDIHFTATRQLGNDEPNPHERFRLFNQQHYNLPSLPSAIHPTYLCSVDQCPLLHQPRLQPRRCILRHSRQAMATRVHAVELPTWHPSRERPRPPNPLRSVGGLECRSYNLVYSRVARVGHGPVLGRHRRPLMDD